MALRGGGGSGTHRQLPHLGYKYSPALPSSHLSHTLPRTWCRSPRVVRSPGMAQGGHRGTSFPSTVARGDTQGRGLQCNQNIRLPVDGTALPPPLLHTPSLFTPPPLLCTVTNTMRPALGLIFTQKVRGARQLPHVCPVLAAIADWRSSY